MTKPDFLAICDADDRLRDLAVILFAEIQEMVTETPRNERDEAYNNVIVKMTNFKAEEFQLSIIHTKLKDVKEQLPSLSARVTALEKVVELLANQDAVLKAGDN